MASPAEQIVGLYERHAAFWARDRGRTLLERSWLDRFLDVLRPRASVLDLGCGSGEPVARYLLERGCAVTGVDSSSTLIRMCRDKFPDQEWIVADMRTLALGLRFDGILAWDSFFHLCPADQRRMFPVFRSHAATGTGLMFTSGTQHGEIIASYCGEPLYHGSLDTAEYGSLLDEQGFEVVAHVSDDPDCGQHTVWLARLK
jgi:SAM-dependent methyltransferase